MIEYISFWFAKALVEILIVVIVFGVLIGGFAIVNLHYRHRVRNETRSFNADAHLGTHVETTKVA